MYTINIVKWLIEKRIISINNFKPKIMKKKNSDAFFMVKYLTNQSFIQGKKVMFVGEKSFHLLKCWQWKIFGEELKLNFVAHPIERWQSRFVHFEARWNMRFIYKITSIFTLYIECWSRVESGGNWWAWCSFVVETILANTHNSTCHSCVRVCVCMPTLI